MKLVLSILSVLLFVFGYYICNLVYPEYLTNKGESAAEWWGLRMNLYATLIFICFLFSVLDTKEWEKSHIKFVLGIGLGLSLSDVVDRIWFNVTVFQAEDVTMIATTFTISLIEAYTKLKITDIKKLFRKTKNV